MTRPDNGGWAFPSDASDGMTYREWLTGLAMQGMVTNPEVSARSFEEIAQLAVCQADALIAALKARHVRESP